MQGHPALPSIRVARPCNSSWELMKGDDRVRRCTNCDRDVYNAAGLNRAEGRALIEGRGGRTCMRLLRRADGTLITGECGDALAVVASPAASRRTLAMAAWLLGIVGIGAALVFLMADRIRHAGYADGGEIDTIDSNL